MQPEPSSPREISTLPDSDLLTDPVIAIHILPDGPLYRLDDFRFSGQIKTRITVGRAAGVDIQLTDPFVSGLHCFLQRQKSRVFVEEYQPKNPLLINGAPLRRGTVEILSGFVVQLGRSYLLACGRAERAQKLHILASGLDEYLHTAVDRYGTQERASEALNVPQSTLSDWLRFGRFRKCNENTETTKPAQKRKRTRK